MVVGHKIRGLVLMCERDLWGRRITQRSGREIEVGNRNVHCTQVKLFKQSLINRTYLKGLFDLKELA